MWAQSTHKGMTSQTLSCRFGSVVRICRRAPDIEEQSNTLLPFHWTLGEDISSALHLGPTTELIVSQTRFLFEAIFWNKHVWEASVLHLGLPSYWECNPHFSPSLQQRNRSSVACSFTSQHSEGPCRLKPRKVGRAAVKWPTWQQLPLALGSGSTGHVS